MPYDSIVCIKQVPDTANVTADAMKEDGTVNRSALPAIFNPEDLNALETALGVRDDHGGTVTAITMGPPKASEVLQAKFGARFLRQIENEQEEYVVSYFQLGENVFT